MQPTQLNLRKGEPSKSADETLMPLPKIESKSMSSAVNSSPHQLSSKMTVLEPEPLNEAVFSSKDLGAFFIYNGHDWEAHDVLGVPQGAHIKDVTAAYQKLLLTAKPEQFVFFEVAYKTLLSKKTKDRL